MTSRDWQADRRAVFERDDHTCRHCGTAGDAADPTALRTYPVGTVPLTGTVHESSLVTVCTTCFETLRASSNAADSTLELPTSRGALFQHVRETTRIQGGAISDVASFASLATSLPTTLSDDETAPASVEETPAQYRYARREVLLAIDLADAHLEALAAVDTEDFDAEIQSSLAPFSETTADLQSTLRTVVELGETVATGVGHCHGCFDSLEERPCSTCGLEARETTDWQHEDGSPAFEQLFSSINDSLQDASTATETLTDQAMTLAELLSDS